MKLFNQAGFDLSSLFLYGVIMFANIDYVGVLDYGLKAALGGAIWFGFRLLQEYYAVRVREKARRQFKHDHGSKPGHE